jgi:hypothetical protein
VPRHLEQTCCRLLFFRILLVEFSSLTALPLLLSLEICSAAGRFQRGFAGIAREMGRDVTGSRILTD